MGRPMAYNYGNYCYLYKYYFSKKGRVARALREKLEKPGVLRVPYLKST